MHLHRTSATIAPLLVALAATLTGCASTSTQTTVRVTHQTTTTRTVTHGSVSLYDVAGRYRGLNPSCPGGTTPNCGGMDVVLTISPHYTYRITTTVLRRTRPYSYTSEGRYRWDAAQHTIILASKDANTRLRYSGHTLQRTGSDTMTSADIAREPMVLRRY